MFSTKYSTENARLGKETTQYKLKPKMEITEKLQLVTTKFQVTTVSCAVKEESKIKKKILAELERLFSRSE